MEVFLTDNRGFGVRAAEPIARGTFIVEYTGAAVRRALWRPAAASAHSAWQDAGAAGAV